MIDIDKSCLAAHRGGFSDLPENSLSAFKRASQNGVGYIEMDVQMTADWEIVVSHDNNINRMTGYKFEIDQMSYEKLKLYPLLHEREPTSDFIPKLEDALAVIAKSQSKVLLEIKPPAGRSFDEARQLVVDCYKIVKDADMLDRTIFMSLDIGLLMKLRESFPKIRVCYPGLSGDIEQDLQIAKDTEFDVFGCPKQEYSKGLLDRIHEAGLQSFVFVLDNYADCQKYLDDGVDIVMPHHIDPIVS